jgi:hypothetical protein
MTLTSWVSTNHSQPNVFIKCQGKDCEAVIVFNRGEILERKRIGTNTSTPCRHCGWHPIYPPEPWNELKGAF